MESAKRKPAPTQYKKDGKEEHDNAAPFTPAPVKYDAKELKRTQGVGAAAKDEVGTGRC